MHGSSQTASSSRAEEEIKKAPVEEEKDTGIYRRRGRNAGEIRANEVEFHLRFTCGKRRRAGVTETDPRHASSEGYRMELFRKREERVAQISFS